MTSSFGWYRPWLISIQRGDLSMKAKALAAALACEERDGVVRATAGFLGTLCSCNERSVRRALDELAEGGWLRRVRSRDRLVITLVASSDPVPDLEQIGQRVRSQIGHTVRADRTDGPGRSDTESDRTTEAAGEEGETRASDQRATVLQEADARVPAGAASGAFHPRFQEVMDILAEGKGLVVEPASVNSALRAKPNADALAAAHTVVSWSHEPGGLNIAAANRLLLRAFERQADDHARRAARAGAAAASRPLVGGRDTPVASDPSFAHIGRTSA